MKNQKEINETEILGWGGVKWYREKIVEMVEQMENPLILKLIYGFTKSGYKEEKAGRK